MSLRETTAGPSTDAVAAPWGWLEAVFGLLAAAVIYLVGSFIVGLAFNLAGGRAFLDQHMLAFEIVAYQFLALGVASVAGWLILMRYRLSPAAVGFRFPGWRSLGNAVAVVPVVLVAVSILVALFNTLVPAYHVQGNSQELIPSGHPHIGVGTEVLVLIWAAVEVPLVEETLFRGILFQGLRNSFGRLLPPAWGLFVAALASGLIFGLAHLEPHTLPILALLGVALAYVFQTARSLYASAVVHGLINALSVVVVFHSL